MKKIVLAGLLGAATYCATAQHVHQGFCATPPADVAQLEADIAAGKQIARELQSRSAMTTYIPVNYTLLSRDNGTGQASRSSLLDLFDAVNVDFADQDIVFFLDNEAGTGDLPWREIPSTSLYESSGSSPNQMAMRQLKVSNAVNIYVPNTADSPGGSGQGVTLGYYSPSNDFLVFRRSEIGSDASTASHEFGHFFGLPHPFLGWDAESWNGTVSVPSGITSPVTQTTAPNGRTPVELVTRGAGANCETAGDRFCDTPADYNLGFGWPNCDYTGDVQDANGDLLRPDEMNIMGYFLRCTPYRFSDEQKATMMGNYASARRSSIRANNSPSNTNFVTESAEILSPTEGSITEFSDQVVIEWDAVPEAQYYLLQVSTRQSFSPSVIDEVIVDGSTSYTAEGLDATRRYYARVRAFNQVSGGSWSTNREFRTGLFTSGVNDVTEAAEAIRVSPNPLTAGESLRLAFTLDAATDVSIEVRDMTGRTVTTLAQAGFEGRNTVDVATAELTGGSYLVAIRSSRGISTRKFVVR